MVNRLFIPPANRAYSDIGTPEAAAQLYVTETGTNTQVQLYTDSDLLSTLSQPVVADSDGVFQPIYVAGGVIVRLLITDADDVALAGYPMDDVVLWPGEAVDASGVTFSPTDTIPATDVQTAIEMAAALSTDQSALIERGQTVWPTGGTGDAYTITPDPAIISYQLGQSFWFKPDRANAGAVTMDINGRGARDLQKTDPSTGNPAALTAGDLEQYRSTFVIDDGVRLLMMLRRDDERVGAGFFRSAAGWQVVAAQVTLPYANAASCAATVTFPLPFSAPPPFIGGTLVGLLSTDAGTTVAANLVSVLIDELGPVYAGPRTTSAVTLRVYQTGAHDFHAGDFLNCLYIAVGKWK